MENCIQILELYMKAGIIFHRNLLIAIDGKGHWHSNEANGVNSTKELWTFFKRHQLNQASVPDPNFQI